MMVQVLPAPYASSNSSGPGVVSIIWLWAAVRLNRACHASRREATGAGAFGLARPRATIGPNPGSPCCSVRASSLIHSSNNVTLGGTMPALDKVVSRSRRSLGGRPGAHAASDTLPPTRQPGGADRQRRAQADDLCPTKQEPDISIRCQPTLAARRRSA